MDVSLSVRSRLFSIVSAVALVAGGALMVTAAPAAAAPDNPMPSSDTGLWIVRLAGQSLVESQAPGDRVDVDSEAARDHRAQLADQQRDVLEAISQRLDRPVDVRHTFRNVLNAIVIEAEPEEAAGLIEVPGVIAVDPDTTVTINTDVSSEWIGAPAVWDGDTGPGLPTRGEGVVVGVIDTGINPDHPAFAATDGDGYTHTNPYPGYLGVCDPAHPQHEPICNDKLVGAYSFVASGESPQDVNGHGSHTASIAAGNTHDATLVYGDDEITRTVHGVAPRANVVAYKVCPDVTCESAAMIAAIEQAVLDEVDVLNMSITTSSEPWIDSVNQALLDAFGAGIFVSLSAGNSGPASGTANSPAPWAAAAGATTTDRIIANSLSVLGPTPVPPELAGIEAWPGAGAGITTNLEAGLRYARQVGDEEACQPYAAGAFTGMVALILDGACSSATKVDNVAAAGAVGAVIYDARPGPPLASREVTETTIPVFQVDSESGDALRDYVYFAGGPVTVRIDPGTAVVQGSADANLVHDLSSRGPNRYDLLVPTMSAPGVNVLAAWRERAGDPAQYEFQRGTSMASPHVAGAGALLKALHPTWSPAEVRAALAGTADPTGLTTPDGTPADPFDTGAGLVDVAGAGRVGLVLDESYANMAAADPATGGDPRTLNVPYLLDRECDTACAWTRVVTNVADVPTSYTATLTGPSVTGTVQPSSFTLPPGATQQLTITVDVSGTSGGDWVFADVLLDTSDAHAGGEPISDVHYPVAVVATAPAVSVVPDGVEASQPPGHQVTRALAIQNAGNVPLPWELAGGTGCDLPADVPWLAASAESGTVPAPPASLETASEHPRLTLDSTGLAPGSYTATLCVDSGDPGRPRVEVPVTFTVLDTPMIEVSPAELEINQPADTVTNVPLTIDNSGTAALDWSFGESPVAVDPAALGGVDPDRRALLEAGVLLAPDNLFPPTDLLPGIAALDPRNGQLLHPALITYPEEVGQTADVTLSPAGDGFLVSDNSADQIHEFNLNGAYQGVFVDGEAAGLDNLRGLAVSPWGTLLVVGQNSRNVAEFDATGTYLGDLIAPEAGGILSPQDVLVRDSDVLVSASNGIFQFAQDGTPLSRWQPDIANAGQLAEQADGNVLAAALSFSPGVWELTPDGELVDIYTGATPANVGVHPLADGNILTVNFDGVHVIDRGATLLGTQIPAGSVQHYMIADIGQLLACELPDEVPWLSVSADSGTIAAAADQQLSVQIDTTGLALGTYQTELCVHGNDPDMPVVSVPVSVTVTGGAGGDCLVDYQVNSQWEDNFQTTVMVTNTSGATVNGWSLTWTFTAGQELVDLWNGIESQTGADVTVVNEPWNAAILPGDSVTIGFTATHAGTNPDPVGFALNGLACDTA